MLDVARELKVGIFEEPLDADGYLLWKGSEARILINERLRYEGRRQFTIAHEVGHFYMPHHQSQMYRCSGRDIEAYTRNNEIENEANEFAAEFLLPSVELDKYLKHPPNLEDAILVEESIGFNRLGMVLTLLHMPACEDDEEF